MPVEHADALHEALRRCGVKSDLLRLQADHLLAAPALGIGADDAWSDVGRGAAFFSARLA